jgi:hypothetical protein
MVTGGRSESFGALAWASVVLALVVLVAACTPPPPDDGTPAITSFSASRTSAPAPLTTAFTWSIADSDSSTFTCGLDLDDDGTFEVTIASCTNSSVRSATFDSPGTHPVRLRVSDGTTTVASAPISLSVGAASADPYAITVRFNGTLTAPQQAAFDAAAARWSQVVRTGLSDLPVNVPANLCGAGAPGFSGTIDDLMIEASIEAIDGPGGVLGSAGPCITRGLGGLPIYGAMRFDSADVAGLEANGRLETVILHEMGHVLGIGTVWGSRLTGAGTTNPVFTGLAARGAWDALVGGSGESVPVANTGGPGTADAHWRESVFGNELMTGYLNGGSNPLSAVTVGSLDDVGYGVDLGAADPYGTPTLRTRSTSTTQLTTQLLFPVGQVSG